MNDETRTRPVARPEAADLLARYIERHVADGTRLDLASLCRGAPDLLPELQARVARYEALDRSLGGPAADAPARTPDALPSWEGFRTIERIGSGGMGDVYKLEDSNLHRVVAAKVVRPDRIAPTSVTDFLREARSLALFQDPRIVQVHEFRAEASPPVLIMEHVDGFPLAQVAPSLEYSQRAKILAEIADAIHRAHSVGLTHRDLKPGNILLDRRLAPKILDFGLASDDASRGHGVGTLRYLAPEQLDPSRPIDARTDVHALGVILYELLCGAAPYDAASPAEIVARVVEGRPRLPAEIEPSVPEPLQAIALKAMERRPADRYQSARDMAQELRRWLEGRPVLARPTLYQSALEQRVRPHLQQLAEWERLNLIHEHERERLASAYRRLDSRDEDWIVQGRTLSFSQIALYLGAFLVACGSILYFSAARIVGEIEGLAGPLLTLGFPFMALNVAAWRLWRGEHRAVSVAFHVAAVLLLPLFLAVALSDLGWLAADPEASGQVLSSLSLSNRQLQAALGLGAAWALALAFRTRTVALSATFALLLALAHLALLSDFGLQEILEDGRWDRLAARLVPLLLVMAAAGWWADVSRRSWLSNALLVGAAIVFVGTLELATLEGRAFEHLGLTLARFQSELVEDPRLIDTLGAMTLAGVLVYVVGALAERGRSLALRHAAQVLLVLAPFCLLEPLAWLNGTEDYAAAFGWAYLALSLLIVVLSHYRQRRAFYHAGLLNTGAAIWFISDRNDWFEEPSWGQVVTMAGLVALAAGLLFHARERSRRSA